MAALMRNAMFRATTESMKLYFRDWWIPSDVFTTLRDWTREEWRYRLCGITVAPMMPMA
jgi:hypothetical protein